MNIFHIIGWIGSVLFILSYLLLSIKKLDANKAPYHLMNIFGGLCLLISAYSSKDGPNFFTNLIWVFIGVYAIILIFRVKKVS